MVSKALSGKTLELVAERFRVLGDPVRLRLLQALEPGEKSVAELVEATGASQANVSKHLQLILPRRRGERRREGLFVLLFDPRCTGVPVVRRGVRKPGRPLHEGARGAATHRAGCGGEDAEKR